MTRGTMMLIPPHPYLCQICGADHEQHLPHNRDSLYYQVAFQMQHGAYPTWADAMAHCSDEMKQLWTDALTERGIDIGTVTQVEGGVA